MNYYKVFYTKITFRRKGKKKNQRGEPVAGVQFVKRNEIVDGEKAAEK